ncbi:MAG: hypothetical protein ACXWUX_15395 [Allosphingosinicella sp.]
MIARGFKPVGWVAAIGAAALGCYMLSLQVAAERAELTALEHRIVRTQQSIRSLQTELGTRGRLQQLEQWNADLLALSAPAAGQFLESNVSLARFDVRQPSFGDQAEVRVAAAEAAPERPAAAKPPVRLAAADMATPARIATPAPAETAPAQPLLRRASLTVPPGATPSAAPARPATAPARIATAASRPSVLLDESTLRDLRAASRTEGDGGTRN